METYIFLDNTDAWSHTCKGQNQTYKEKLVHSDYQEMKYWGVIIYLLFSS